MKSLTVVTQSTQKKDNKLKKIKRNGCNYRAGIAGMSAGCYLQMNGYQTEIFEINVMCSGLCTSWKRNGFTFDPCTHWLVGTRLMNRFYRMWVELSVLQDTTIHNHQRFKFIQSITGIVLSICIDVDQLEQGMLAIVPEDK